MFQCLSQSITGNNKLRGNCLLSVDLKLAALLLNKVYIFLKDYLVRLGRYIFIFCLCRNGISVYFCNYRRISDN